MKSILLATLLASALGLGACSSKSEPELQTSIQQRADHGGHEHAHADTGHTEVVTGLVLNEGHKWPMDEHTRSVLQQMDQLVGSVEPVSLPVDGRKALGKGLQSLVGDLVSGCTMTGTAHDQLHLFLSEYIPAVEKLAGNGDTASADLVIHHLERYRDFFE